MTAAQSLTVALVTRHFQSRVGGWDPAMLDIAQDHALCHLDEQRLFSMGLVFKGGTALRKCRSGPAGRFSTDLDFTAYEPGLAALVLESLDGHSCHGFTFTMVNLDTDAGRGDLVVDAPIGRTNASPTRVGIPSKVELSGRPCWLRPETLEMLPSPVHRALGHSVPELPVMATEESIAEKLARYSRVGLARDLYDLDWFGKRQFNEDLVRRLWVQKVFGDVVVDKRWKRDFDPADILKPRHANTIDEESIGFLTRPTDIPAWERQFRARYAFLGQLNSEDQRWAGCSPRDEWEWRNRVAVVWDANGV